MKENTFTQFDRGRAILKYLAFAAVESTLYDSWPDEFKVKNLKNEIKRLKEAGFTINPHKLAVDEMEKLHFQKWDENLILVPQYLTPFLEEGIELTSIDGRTVTTPLEDTDSRGGILAYGVKILAA